MEQTLSAIADVTKPEFSKQFKIPFLVKCFSNVQKGVSIPQSLVLATNILKNYYSHQNAYYLQVTQVIQEFNKRFPMIDLIIKDIENYHAFIKERMKVLAEKKKVPEQINSHIFQGSYTHEINLEKRLDFMEYLITSTKNGLTLANDNIEKMWNIFVAKANFNFETSLFLKWINKDRQTYSHKPLYIFNDTERRYFFESILCNSIYLDFNKLSKDFFFCFQKYFKILNTNDEKIEIIGRSLRVLDFDKLHGMETLWAIVLKSPTATIREPSISLLVDMHLKHDDSVDPKKKIEIWEGFLSRCMGELSEPEDENKINAAIELLTKFLNIYEGKKPLKPEHHQAQFYNNVPTANLHVLNKTD